MKRNRFLTWTIAMVLMCWGLNISGPDTVMGESDISETLLTVDCLTLRKVGLSLVADYFYADDPAGALTTILFIEDRCGSDEPLRRIQLLGSIWDGSFSENIYGPGIINDLAQREDEANIDLRFAYYDSFTTNMANQLLPHVERQSLEEFFCLFHSGRTDDAYALLQDGSLDGTMLESYYTDELDYLEIDRLYGFGGVYGSYWQPSGNLARLGRHAMAGVNLGWQYGDWFARADFGFRFARSKYPYYVDYDGEAGWSDRTVGAKMTVDFGVNFYSRDRQEMGVFLGGGIDVLHPFNGVEEYTITGAVGLVGLEYKLWLGKNHHWNINVGVRKEWYGSWDGDGSDLSGDAWDLRMGVGISLGHGDYYKRRAYLGY